MGAIDVHATPSLKLPTYRQLVATRDRWISLDPMHFKLVDARDGSEISISSLPLTIGRGDTASLCLHDRWVSRLHCEVTSDNEGLLVRDLGSRHGTMVNGETIRERRLHPGDALVIGLLQFQVSAVPSDVGVTS